MKDDSSFFLRSFRVANDSTDADFDMALEKSNEVGQNDIHLEVMGPWKETLYPDINGVPESLMALLSQTIRLANEQELPYLGSTVDTQVLENLRRRAGLLEQYILSWKPPSGQSFVLTDNPAIENGENTKTQAAAYIVRAMHQALVLFYYRRIPNVNTLILQDTVQRCYSLLQQHDQTCINGGMFNDSFTLARIRGRVRSVEYRLAKPVFEVAVHHWPTHILSFVSCCRVNYTDSLEVPS